LGKDREENDWESVPSVERAGLKKEEIKNKCGRVFIKGHSKSKKTRPPSRGGEEERTQKGRESYRGEALIEGECGLSWRFKH